MSRKEDLQKLINKNQRRLQKLQEQKASFGIYTPPHILTEIEDIEAEIADLQAELAELKAAEAAYAPDIETILRNQADDRYDSFEFIDRGGFAAVFRVRDKKFPKRDVAFKLVHGVHLKHSDMAKRFNTEVNTAAGLRHQNLITIWDYKNTNGKLYLTMPFIQPNLNGYLAERGQLPPGEALDIIRQLAEGLDHLHSHNTIHRDLKPANVLIETVSNKPPQAVITDFGLAQSMEESSTRLSQQGKSAGTAKYMAPEQINPKRFGPIDEKADLYALGLIAYELLTGKHPFSGENSQAYQYEHTNEPPPKPSQVNPNLPSTFNKPLLKALKKKPKDRYNTATDFVNALQNAWDSAQRRKKDVRSSVPYWLMGLGATALIVVLFLSALGLRDILSPPTNTPAPANFNYWVRVVDSATNARIANANVAITIQGEAPLNAVTDSTGLARFVLDTGINNYPAYLQVEANGHHPYTKNITLAGNDELAELAELELLPAASPTIAYTPIPPTPTPTLSPGDTRTRQIDGMTQVYVPAGTFTMGSDDNDDEANDDEKPAHEQTMTAFWIDQTEVTNAQYNLCVEAGVCPESKYADNTTYNGDNYPVVGVSWYNARDYCEWAGSRLPTEAEWEYAARGRESLLYPWGNEPPNSDLLNFNNNVGATTQVGNYPAGASWVNALDMAGNVWEWVQSEYQDYPYSAGDGRENLDSTNVRVLRGGSWASKSRNVRAANRLNSLPVNSSGVVGFRCISPPGSIN